MRTLVWFVVVILAGCATPYQPAGLTGGFSETQLARNVFQVRFKGNGFTRMERATDFTLLRSAELTLQHGYEYFTVVDAEVYRRHLYYTTPTTSTTSITGSTYGTASSYGGMSTYSGSFNGTANTTTYGGQTYNISKPSTSDTIVCFRKRPKGFAFDAAFVESSIRAKYKLTR